MKLFRVFIVGVALWTACAAGLAADDDDDDKNPVAEQNYPQPVRVGALLGRTVLEPSESQNILGHVSRIVRSGDGVIEFVVDYGGFFGIGTRPIAVPVQDMALLGQYVQIIHPSPDDLKRFPTYRDAGNTTLSKDDTIKVGLTRPSH